MRKRELQGGMTTVEFAIVGMTLMMVLFGAIEIGRFIFTVNMLQEGARRAARVAAVCTVGDRQAVAEKVNFADLPGFNTSLVHVEYLDENDGPAGSFDDIRFVRVRVVGYTMPLAIPLLNLAFEAPEFSSTLPRESLGVLGSRSEAVPPC